MKNKIGNRKKILAGAWKIVTFLTLWHGRPLDVADVCLADIGVDLLCIGMIWHGPFLHWHGWHEPSFHWSVGVDIFCIGMVEMGFLYMCIFGMAFFILAWFEWTLFTLS
jgi:hypothetical protein